MISKNAKKKKKVGVSNRKEFGFGKKRNAVDCYYQTRHLRIDISVQDHAVPFRTERQVLILITSVWNEPRSNRRL